MRSLLITKSPPYPCNMGGNQHTHLAIKALSQLGSVDLFLAQDKRSFSESQLRGIQTCCPLAGSCAPQAEETNRVLNKYARWLAYGLPQKRLYEPDPRLAAAVRRVLDKGGYDVCVAARLDLARQAGLTEGQNCILDISDPELEWYASQMDNPRVSMRRRWVARWRWLQLRRFVPELYRGYPHVWVMKEGDRLLPGLEHAKVVGHSYFIPNGKQAQTAAVDPACKRILLVGSFYHAPNVEGLSWFLDQVWPRIAEAAPSAEFRIVGAGLSRRMEKKLAHLARVTGAGCVDDIVAEYADCALSVAPIFFGSGMNLKVFESFLYNRTCVMSRFAYRGYENTLPAGDVALLADEPSAFAEACLSLLANPARNVSMAARGREGVLRDFSFDRYASCVAESLNMALSDRKTEA